MRASAIPLWNDRRWPCHSAGVEGCRHLSSDHQTGQERNREFFRRRPSETASAVVLSIEARSTKAARLEAALFVADAALSARKLSQFATLSGVKEANALIAELNRSYEKTGSPFRIEQVASGYRLLTLPRFAPWLDRLHNRQTLMKLSPPMLETLAIVAYRQPATRADIEAVRGVQSAEILKQLMEKELVKIVGEDDSLGRPYLYGTTRLFLERFGFTSLDHLPMAESLRKQATVAVADEAETDESDPDTTDSEVTNASQENHDGEDAVDDSDDSERDLAA